MRSLRAGTGRSAGSCCCGRAGGRRRLPPAPMRGRATRCCSLLPSPWHLLLFLIGAIAMRGAGCTYNDIVDAGHRRARSSAPARGRCRPARSAARQAWVFLVAAGAGRAGRARCSSTASPILLGIASLVVVAIYPFMKRIHQLAATRARPCLFLGRADGLGGGVRRSRRAGGDALCSARCCG